MKLCDICLRARDDPLFKNPCHLVHPIDETPGLFDIRGEERSAPSVGRDGDVKGIRRYWSSSDPLPLPTGTDIVAFAGLMSSSFSPTNSTEMELSCSILTKEAEGPAEHIHKRMPVVLADTAHKAWLDSEQTDAGKVLEMARECSVSQVEYQPVSTRVNHSKNDGAELLEPFENPA